MANSFKNAAAAIAATSTTVYTCPSATEAVVNSLVVSNVDGSNEVSVTIKVYDDSAATEFTIVQDLPIPVNSGWSLDKNINLEASDEIRMTAGAANDVEAVLGILEVS